MNPISPDRDQAIRQLLRSCGQYAEQMATQQFEVSQKGPDDFVTSIDAALDQKLSAAFTAMFPGDGVITEEDVQSRQKFDAGYPRLWCIDPIDGTEDFIQARRDYAVMVGLLQDHQPIAGWVHAPAHGQTYYGGPAWGLFQEQADGSSQTLLAHQPDSPSSVFCPLLIGHRDQSRFGAAIAERIPEAQFYSLGSFGLKVVEVILGHAGLYLYLNGRVKLWDTTGPLALARTAGLVCCDLAGEPLRFSADGIDQETLAHTQSIIIGWPDYVEYLRPKLKEAVEKTLQNFGFEVG